MTSEHADKMEITVVFQCPPKGRELVLAVFKAVWMFSFPLGKAGMVLVAGEVSMMREGGAGTW